MRLVDRRISRVVTDIRAGKPVIVVDDGGERRGVRANLVFAGERAVYKTLAFVIRHTCGFVCVALPAKECDRLRLPPMAFGDDPGAPSYTVTVDATDGITTGISAIDRAHTMQVLANPATAAQDLCRPGHVVPCRAFDGGVLRRPRFAEAALDLVQAAGLRPAAGFSAMVDDLDHGELVARPTLNNFARQHDLSTISVQELVAYRARTEPVSGAHTDGLVGGKCGVCEAIAGQ